MNRFRLILAMALVLALVGTSCACAQGNFFTALIIGASKEDAPSGYSDALAMLIMAYDWDGSGLRLLTLDRDEVFEGNSLGSIMRLYGADGAKTAVNGLYGLDISNVVTLDMSNIPSIIGGVGGVNLTLSEADAAIMGLAPGLNKISADQARAYLAINITSNPKAEANSRRNRVLEALIAKARDEGISMNLDLAWTALGMMSTNISFFDMVSLGTSVLTSGLGGISRSDMPLAGEGAPSELVNKFLFG